MVLVLLTIVHVLVCVFLIIVVLLQSGKAADLAGAFGGMGSQTAFGPRGSATLLSKATTLSAVLFMFTSLSLSILATRNAGATGGKTVLDKAKAPTSSAPAKTGQAPQQPAPVPAAPAPAPPAPGGVQPSVSLSTEGDANKTKTIPVEIPKPGQSTAPGQAAPPAQSPTGQKK